VAMLLLDHPWPITQAKHRSNEAFGVLEDFDLLIKSKETLDPVPFIDREQYSKLWEEMNADDEARATGSYYVRIVESYIRWNEKDEHSLASPEPEPTGIALPKAWKKALREAMGDLRDWRNPQIVIPERRAECWADGVEIPIRIDGKTAGKLVLAVLEAYNEHPFAASDFDPWDLQRWYVPANENRMSLYPCRLPKHPALENIRFENLGDASDECRRKGWRYSVEGTDRYCYLPPEDWNVERVGREDWRRNCKTFPRADAGGGRGSGPVDHWKRVWLWDDRERHWDVQFAGPNPEDNPRYCVISHDGILLRELR